MSAGEEAPHRASTRMSMTILGLIMAYLAAGKASRDALFLSQFRSSDLPAMIAVAAIIAVIMSIGSGRMLVHVGPNWMTVFFFALSGVLQIGEWVLFGYQPRTAACLIYVHVVGFGAVLVSAFWSLMADPFVRRAAELRCGGAERASAAAGEVGPADWKLAPLLIELLAWDEVVSAACGALGRIGPRIAGTLVDALLDRDGEFVIRRRVPRVLATIPSRRVVEGLFEALQDQRFEVRFYAGRALHLLVKARPELMIVPERVWQALNRELSLQRSVWANHRLIDRRGSNEKQWFFDDQLLNRADRNLEHLFTLLGLLLPADAVRIAFRALHTDDRQPKGTAFEYLENATPPRNPAFAAAGARSRCQRQNAIGRCRTCASRSVSHGR